MPWIKIIELSDAVGLLKRQYDEAVNRAGRLWRIPALGTDSPASNQVTDIWREMQLMVKNYEDLKYPDILAMATMGGANALQQDGDFGCLSVGKKARFIHVSSTSLVRCGDVDQLLKELVSGGRPSDIEWV